MRGSGEPAETPEKKETVRSHPTLDTTGFMYPVTGFSREMRTWLSSFSLPSLLPSLVSGVGENVVSTNTNTHVHTNNFSMNMDPVPFDFSLSSPPLVSTMSPLSVSHSVWDLVLGSPLELGMLLEALGERDSRLEREQGEQEYEALALRVVDQRVEQSRSFEFILPVFGEHGYRSRRAEALELHLQLLQRASTPLHFCALVHSYFTDRIINAYKQNSTPDPEEEEKKVDVLNCAKLLIEHGADISLLNDKNLTPYQYALELKDQEFANLIRFYRGYAQKLKRQVNQSQLALELVNQQYHAALNLQKQSSCAEKQKIVLLRWKLLMANSKSILLTSKLKELEKNRANSIKVNQEFEQISKKYAAQTSYIATLDASNAELTDRLAQSQRQVNALQFKANGPSESEKIWKKQVSDLEQSLRSVNELYMEEQKKVIALNAQLKSKTGSASIAVPASNGNEVKLISLDAELKLTKAELKRTQSELEFSNSSLQQLQSQLNVAQEQERSAKHALEELRRSNLLESARVLDYTNQLTRMEAALLQVQSVIASNNSKSIFVDKTMSIPAAEVTADSSIKIPADAPVSRSEQPLESHVIEKLKDAAQSSEIPQVLPVKSTDILVAKSDLEDADRKEFFKSTIAAKDMNLTDFTPDEAGIVNREKATLLQQKSDLAIDLTQTPLKNMVNRNASTLTQKKNMESNRKNQSLKKWIDSDDDESFDLVRKRSEPIVNDKEIIQSADLNSKSFSLKDTLGKNDSNTNEKDAGKKDSALFCTEAMPIVDDDLDLCNDDPAPSKELKKSKTEKISIDDIEIPELNPELFKSVNQFVAAKRAPIAIPVEKKEIKIPRSTRSALDGRLGSRTTATPSDSISPANLKIAENEKFVANPIEVSVEPKKPDEKSVANKITTATFSKASESAKKFGVNLLVGLGIKKPEVKSLKTELKSDEIKELVETNLEMKASSEIEPGDGSTKPFTEVFATPGRPVLSSIDKQADTTRVVNSNLFDPEHFIQAELNDSEVEALLLGVDDSKFVKKSVIKETPEIKIESMPSSVTQVGAIAPSIQLSLVSASEDAIKSKSFDETPKEMKKSNANSVDIVSLSAINSAQPTKKAIKSATAEMSAKLEKLKNKRQKISETDLETTQKYEDIEKEKKIVIDKPKKVSKSNLKVGFKDDDSMSPEEYEQLKIEVQNDEPVDKNDLILLKKGMQMTKVSRNGTFHPTKVFLKQQLGSTSSFNVMWESDSLWKSSVDCVVFLDDCDLVEGGQTDVFEKCSAAKFDPKLCFSLVSLQRSLDLVANSNSDFNLWTSVIRKLMRLRNKI